MNRVEIYFVNTDIPEQVEKTAGLLTGTVEEALI